MWGGNQISWPQKKNGGGGGNIICWLTIPGCGIIPKGKKGNTPLPPPLFPCSKNGLMSAVSEELSKRPMPMTEDSVSSCANKCKNKGNPALEPVRPSARPPARKMKDIFFTKFVQNELACVLVRNNLVPAD